MNPTPEQKEKLRNEIEVRLKYALPSQWIQDTNNYRFIAKEDDIQREIESLLDLFLRYEN